MADLRTSVQNMPVCIWMEHVELCQNQPKEDATTQDIEEACRQSCAIPAHWDKDYDPFGYNSIGIDNQEAQRHAGDEAQGNQA